MSSKQTNRARAYLATLPRAIQRQRGSDQTFNAACRLVEFSLSWSDALTVLTEWNQTHCEPPWSKLELDHKLRDAFKKTKPKPEFVCSAVSAGVASSQTRQFKKTILPRLDPPKRHPVTPALSGLTLTAGTREEHEALSQLRKISPFAVAIACSRGLLRFTTYEGFATWLIMDQTRNLAQIRRLDGGTWLCHAPDGHGSECKARNLSGSVASWPIGVYESRGFPSIALVEGGADLLAALHFLILQNKHPSWATVAMMGATLSIHPDAIRHFAGKPVRIFQHTDDAGRAAAERWRKQLSHVCSAVDIFELGGLLKTDGQTAKDLNELAFVEEKHLPALFK